MRQCVFALFVAAVLIGCGQTEFTGEVGDQSVARALGDLTSSETTGQIHVLEDLIENPSLAELYPCGNKKEKKVLICHVPPGNAEAAHTICVGAPALAAHLHLHEVDGGEVDTLGACPLDNVD